MGIFQVLSGDLGRTVLVPMEQVPIAQKMLAGIRVSSKQLTRKGP